VANTSANQVIEYSASSLAGSTPEPTVVVPSVTNPTRLALDPTTANPTLWITSTSGGAVYAYDLTSPSSPKTTITQSINRPLGVAVDSRGFVYVGDNGNNSITVYHNAGGAPAFSWTTFGSTAFTAPGTLLYVQDDPFAAPFGGAIYIGLGGTVEGVYVFTADSLTSAGPSLVRSFTDSSISGPVGLGVSPNSSTTVYVANYYTESMTGYSIVSPGAPTLSEYLISQPQGLAVDPSGNIYVAIPSYNQLVEYSASGTVLRFLSGAQRRSNPARR
jgi:sugar lactone lactonase YvrE